MTPPPFRIAGPFAGLLLALPAAAQDPPSGRFGVERAPLMVIAVNDLPALLGAWEKGGLGRVFATPGIPEIVEDIEARHRRYVDVTGNAIERALEEQLPLPPHVLFARAVAPLGWRDLHTVNFELLVREGDTERSEPAMLLAVEPTEAARAATLERATSVTAGDYWLGASTRQVAMTMGEPQRNVTDDRPAGPPGAVFELHMTRFLDLVFESTRRYSPEIAERELRFLEGLGLTSMDEVRWQLSADGPHVREEVRVRFDGKPVGLAAAIADGMAPLPNLPAPKGTMLQLRLSLDVNHLVAAIKRDARERADGRSARRLRRPPAQGVDGRHRARPRRARPRRHHAAGVRLARSHGRRRVRSAAR